MSAGPPERIGLGSGLIGAVLSNRYRLDSKLGSGGMSTVYLALDQTLERWVAIKILHREMSDQPDQLERFRRESRTVAQLSHPNVVSVIDAGDDAGHPYIVFEYVKGETLKQRIDRLRRLPLDEAAAYAIEIGRGLQAAHAAQLVHRDVKPQNVLIDTEGRAKVTDFGIALSLEADGLTKTGRVFGTTDYVSPEQAMGREVDARSDIYALGRPALRDADRRRSVQGRDAVGVAMKHVNDPMPDVQKRRPGVSAALAAVIERSTEKDPASATRTWGRCSPTSRARWRSRWLAPAARTARLRPCSIPCPPGAGSCRPGGRIDRRDLCSCSRGLLIALAIAKLGGDDGPIEPGQTARRPARVRSRSPVRTISTRSAVTASTRGDRPGDRRLPTTGWTTETYTASPVLADSGKDGVGLIVDAGQPVAAGQLEILTDTPGWGGAIYGAAEGPPADLAGWGDPIAADFTVDNEDTRVQLDASSDSRYFLIWITELAPETNSVGRATPRRSDESQALRGRLVRSRNRARPGGARAQAGPADRRARDMGPRSPRRACRTRSSP